MHGLEELRLFFRTFTIDKYLAKLSPCQVVLCYILERFYRIVCLLSVLYATYELFKLGAALAALFLLSVRRCCEWLLCVRPSSMGAEFNDAQAPAPWLAPSVAR